jgi:hypothetical protein
MGTSGELLWTRLIKTFGFHSILGNSWAVERLVAAQEGLSSTELVSLLLVQNITLRIIGFLCTRIFFFNMFAKKRTRLRRQSCWTSSEGNDPGALMLLQHDGGSRRRSLYDVISPTSTPVTVLCVKRWRYPCNRPWKPIRLCDVEAPIFFRQSAHRWRIRLSALQAGRPLPPGRYLVLTSVRDWADPRAILRLKNPMTL